MIINSVKATILVSQFLKETDYELKAVETEIDVCDLFMYDKENQKTINYGNVNNIINSKEFKKWYEKTKENKYER